MDITPNWTFALGVYLRALERDEEDRHEAENGIMHMAAVAQAYADKHDDGWRTENGNRPLLVSWQFVASLFLRRNYRDLDTESREYFLSELTRMAQIADMHVAEEKVAA
jgi:hypothetical protein